MAITSTHPLPQLAPVYLMTGYLDPERTKGGQAYPKSGTLLPVADRYFSYLTHTHEETLIATDGKGLLRSFDSKLEPLQPKQHLNQQPLKLNVLPQGLVRQAFFANLADWQKVLVDEIRKAKLAHAYKTLPFRFEKKDLRTPEEDDEVGREAHSGFKEGMKYFGQLFPRVQAVLFLVPAGILSGGKVKATLRKDGNVVTTFTEDGNGLKRTFEKKNSLTYALESAEYVCYSHASTDGSLAEGFYTLEIPGSALRKERFPSDSPILTGGLRFGCDVKFSLHTLYGDFDYHVLNLVSVESALLSNFPDTFAHLQKSLFTPAAPGGTAPGGGSAGEDGGKARASQSVKTTLKSWAEGFEWAHAKRQMALGYLNADNEGRIKSLLSAVLDCLQDGESDSMGHSAKVVKGFWVLVTKGPALNKEWQKIFDSVKILEKNLGKLDLVRQAVDANFVTRVFQETRWQRYILDELRAAEKLWSDGKAVTNKFVLELVKKDASPKALRALMKDGIPREARNFEKLFESNSKAAVKALWMLDVAYTAYSVASAVKDLSQKDAEAEVQDRRLADALAKYAEKQKGSTHPLVLERLDGLRKLSDAARSGLSAAQLAAGKTALSSPSRRRWWCLSSESWSAWPPWAWRPWIYSRDLLIPPTKCISGMPSPTRNGSTSWTRNMPSMSEAC